MYIKKFKRLFTLSNLFVGYFFTTATASSAALSTSATFDVIRDRKLEQPTSVILASSERKTRSQQLADVRLEELKPRMIPISEGKETSDLRFDFYNNIVRAIQNLPSNGQSREISTEDNNIQRLLKQQLNDSLEIYQIIGQLLDAGKLNSLDSNALSFIDDEHLSFYQGVLIAIAETNLATNIDDQLVANNMCLRIAEEGARNAQLLEEAGLGTRSDVLIAYYFVDHCAIQRLKLGFDERDAVSNAIRDAIKKSQTQQQRLIDLEDLYSPLMREMIEDRQENNIRDARIDYYQTNIKLLQKLSFYERSLEIHTEDSDVQQLQQHQLSNLLELHRLQGLRLTAEVLNDNSDAGEIMLPAILIAISDINLATKPNERAVASRVCLEIVRAWEKDVFARRETALNFPIKVLTVNYWKRQCDLQKLQAESI